ncbi:MAG TPA: phospholipase domain-containing protein, partial [Cyclobacteriaceae bacterium]
ESETGLFMITMEARNDLFKDKSAGAPFTIYVYGKQWSTRAYAVTPGGKVTDSFSLGLFDNRKYAIRVDGPNGFMREYRGDAAITVDMKYSVDKPSIDIQISDARKLKFEIVDNAYSGETQLIDGGSITLDLSKTSGWYDSTILSDNFEFHFAGRVETGKESTTDPALDGPAF